MEGDPGRARTRVRVPPPDRAPARIRRAAGAILAVLRRLRAPLESQRALIVILAVGLPVAFALAFGADRVYDAVTESDGVEGLDDPALRLATALRSPALDAVAAAVASVFGPVWLPVLAAAACLLLALRRRTPTPITLTAGAGAGSLLMTVAGKDVIDRHRPPLSAAIPPFETSPSFPSGHTLNAVVICGVLAYLLVLARRTAGARSVIVAGAAVLVIVVGLTRVLLGAHWLTDVLAGWLLGGAWLALVITAHRLFLMRRAGRTGHGRETRSTSA